MTIKIVKSEEELTAACRVLVELRNQFTAEDLRIKVKNQIKNGYRLVIAENNGIIQGTAGFVMSEKLAWGKHIYIDDLITLQQYQSSGVGKAIIDWIKDYGSENGCQQIHLDSGVQRYDAHRFYLNQGFIIASHHFSIK